MPKYKIDAGTGQHIGDRSEQQDRVALLTAAKAPGYVMAILADGMGGRTGGAIAAEQVVRTAQQHFNSFSPLTDSIQDMLQKIVEETHTVIKLSGLSAEKEPHSTFVALILSPDGDATWAHVGDSRLYRFQGPNFLDHTIDHSYVEKLVSEGKLDRNEAKHHRLSNILVNVLGSSTSDPYITLGRQTFLKQGDSFLLCSDGLWHFFNEAELGAAIAMNRPREGAELLIKKARERSKGIQADNCTLAIIKLVSPDEDEKNYTIKKMRRAV